MAWNGNKNEKAFCIFKGNNVLVLVTNTKSRSVNQTCISGAREA